MREFSTCAAFAASFQPTVKQQGHIRTSLPFLLCSYDTLSSLEWYSYFVSSPQVSSLFITGSFSFFFFQPVYLDLVKKETKAVEKKSNTPNLSMNLIIPFRWNVCFHSVFKNSAGHYFLFSHTACHGTLYRSYLICLHLI